MFNIVTLLKELFGKRKVVIHLTNDAGESMRIQRILTEEGIRFDQEIEGNAPVQLQMQMGYVSPTIKIKVKPEDVHLAQEAIRKKGNKEIP
ncbi:hypothetical protein [Ammoniphilus sp. 3BR4]|uniref:hypothetical protein n=1 Tax=Ammoniphilus sp. 3BR4 TaxID=3158265 RepID=UPI003466FC51